VFLIFKKIKFVVPYTPQPLPTPFQLYNFLRVCMRALNPIHYGYCLVFWIIQKYTKYSGVLLSYDPNILVYGNASLFIRIFLNVRNAVVLFPVFQKSFILFQWNWVFLNDRLFLFSDEESDFEGWKIYFFRRKNVLDKLWIRNCFTRNGHYKTKKDAHCTDDIGRTHSYDVP